MIPVASVIFMHRTQPRGTSLGALALGLAFTAAGGAALYAAIPSYDTTVQVSGYITAAVLLSIGPLMLIGGIAATGLLSPSGHRGGIEWRARRRRLAAAARPERDRPGSGGDGRARSTAGPGPRPRQTGLRPARRAALAGRRRGREERARAGKTGLDTRHG